MGLVDCRIESQMWVTGTSGCPWLRKRGQLGPPLCGGIADDETEAFFFGVVVAGAEEEAIAGVHQINTRVLHRSQEREQRVDEFDDRGGETRKVVAKTAIVAAGGIEEARKGLWQQFAVGGLGDEIAPKLRDALAKVDGPGGETGEDLDDEVVREEAGRRRRRRRRRQSVLRP
jgi:hypothetical protein